MIRTNCFSAAPCSFDLQTTVSCYNFKLDKDPIYAGLRTGLFGRDWIHKSLYNLLHFSSQQRNKFLYFCSTIVNIVFSFINISTLQQVKKQKKNPKKKKKTPEYFQYIWKRRDKSSSSSSSSRCTDSTDFFNFLIGHLSGRSPLFVSRLEVIQSPLRGDKCCWSSNTDVSKCTKSFEERR